MPVSFIASLRAEIDELRGRLSLPVRQWESPQSPDAVDPVGAAPCGVPSTREKGSESNLRATPQGEAGLLATEIAWPQEAEDLIAMADEWPCPTTDGGDMFSGDVLIKKLGQALRATCAPSVTPEDEP